MEAVHNTFSVILSRKCSRQGLDSCLVADLKDCMRPSCLVDEALALGERVAIHTLRRSYLGHRKLAPHVDHRAEHHALVSMFLGAHECAIYTTGSLPEVEVRGLAMPFALTQKGHHPLQGRWVRLSASTSALEVANGDGSDLALRARPQGPESEEHCEASPLANNIRLRVAARTLEVYVLGPEAEYSSLGASVAGSTCVSFLLQKS